MKKKILFVCMGNICRSPAAEEIFRQKVAAAGLADQYEIDSAGTYSGHRGDLPDPRMRRAAERRGYTLTHRARPVLDEDFGRFDMLVAMDDRNVDALERLAFTLDDRAKIYRMAKLAFDGRYTDDVIKKWLVTFCRRFFAQQFKRSCLPDGPKVGSVTLSPRGDFRMPSDACAALWMEEANAL